VVGHWRGFDKRGGVATGREEWGDRVGEGRGRGGVVVGGGRGPYGVPGPGHGGGRRGVDGRRGRKGQRPPGRPHRGIGTPSGAFRPPLVPDPTPTLGH